MASTSCVEMDEDNDESDNFLTEFMQRKGGPSVAAKMIHTMNEIIKKPTIEADMSDMLVKYLDYLRKNKIFLENGVFTVSFAEGALLIQSATLLYSKKVDMMWDVMVAHLERNMSYEVKTPENEVAFQQIEERKERFKRKRKKKIEVPVPTESTSLDSVECNIDAKDIDSLLDTHDDYFDLEANHENNSPFGKWEQEKPPVNKNCPVVCDLDDKDNVKLLKSEMFEPEECFYRRVDFEVTVNTEDEGLEPIFNLEDLSFHVQNGISIRHSKYQLEKLKIPEAEITPMDAAEYMTDMYIRKKQISAANIYMDFDKFLGSYSEYLQELSRREVVSDRRYSSVSECNEAVKDGAARGEVAVHRKTVDARSDVDSGFFEHPDDSDSAVNRNDSGIFSPPQFLLSPLPAITFPTPETVNTLNVDKHNNNTTKEIKVFQRQIQKRKKNILLDTDSDDKPKRQRLRLRPVIISELKSFELFQYYNYKTEEEEGVIIRPEFPDTDDEDNFDNTADVVTEVPNLETIKLDFIKKNDSHLKYREWETFIRGKLKDQSPKDFDIHEEGTKIINAIGNINETKSYKDMCAGKSSREVARNFIAMLQLANDSNVEIINPTPGCVANNTLSLRLLSKERHHEGLEKYNAPSELSLRERMSNVKSMAEKHKFKIPAPSTSFKKRKVALK